MMKKGEEKTASETKEGIISCGREHEIEFLFSSSPAQN